MTELVRPMDVEQVHCAECGEMADRLICAPSMIVGPTLHPNLSMDARWQESRERAEVGFKHVGAKGH